MQKKEGGQSVSLLDMQLKLTLSLTSSVCISLKFTVSYFLHFSLSSNFRFDAASIKEWASDNIIDMIQNELKFSSLAGKKDQF